MGEQGGMWWGYVMGEQGGGVCVRGWCVKLCCVWVQYV